jgi:transposase
MRIIGADACKERIVYCVFDSENMPKDFQLYYLDGDNFHEAYASAKGMKEILSLNPDVLAIEPTGMNYIRLWIRKMSEAGVKVALIGHRQIKDYRGNMKLPDKDDPADALALGAYYAEHHLDPARFVLLRDETTAQLRETALRLGHLVRLQSPMINRLQQDLAYTFPERANTGANASLFWKWVASTKKSLKYDLQMKDSIGSGITPEMRLEASLLCMVQAEEKRVEFELRNLLNDDQFTPYRKVLREYGFGERAQAVIISQIYPLENFLEQNKQPSVMVTKGKISRKPTKKHLSLRRYTKMLGIAPTREQSGSSPTKTKKAGSQLCRTALWQWIFTRIEPVRSRLKNEKGQQIFQLFETYVKHKGTKLARAKTIGKVIVMIFYDLVNAINESVY